MSSRIGKNQSRTRIFPRRRGRGQKRGVATAIGAILFFMIAFQIIAFIYEVNQVSTEMLDFDLQKSREFLEISSIGFNDYSPTSLQISSGLLISGTVDSLKISDSDRLILSSEESVTALTPTSYNLLGSTQLVSGSVSNLVSDDGSYLIFTSYPGFSSTTPTQSFIGYRSNTGTSLTNSPKGSSWDGDSWSNEEELPDAGSSVRWVRAAHSLASARWKESIMVTLSDDGFLDAYVWDGSSWLYQSVGGQDIGFVGTTANSYRPFDIAYERTSGRAILVYGISSTSTSQDLAYRIWDGLSWSAEAYIDDTTEATDIQYYWLQLASYPLNTGRVDEIALIAIDGTNEEANAWVWDGNAWGNLQEFKVKRATEEAISVTYEQTSGDAMFISGDGDLKSRKWTGLWQTELPKVNLGDDARWLTLKADPSSNQLMAVITNMINQLETAYWSGSGWTLITHDNGVDSITTRVADFDWEPSGGKGLLVWGTKAGKISWRTFTAPSTWDNISEETNSGTHAWIQLRRNTRDVNGDLKIVGATLNSDNELHVFKWDGQNLDFQTDISQDVAGTTWESFDLSWRYFGDPSYLAEVELVGSGGVGASKLDWMVDSSWTTGKVNVRIQLFSYSNNQYVPDQSSYGGNAYSSYESSTTPNTDESISEKIDQDAGDFVDSSGNWKIKVKGEKQTETQFDFRVDLIQYEFEVNELDWAGIFSIDESPTEISALEITYQAFSQGGSTPIAEVFIYNFTSLSWDSIAQVSLSGLEATAGPITVGGIPTDYIDGSSQVRVSVNSTLTDPTNLYSNYLHLRVTPLSGSGIIKIDFFNSGANDIHLVDLWIINGTTPILFNFDSSPSFDNTVFPGETNSASFNFDWKEGESYRVRVVSERGGIWSRFVSP